MAQSSIPVTPRVASKPIPNLPHWEAILTKSEAIWNSSKKKSGAGPKVLIATSVGGFSALGSLESLAAVALTLRGAQVHILLCDRDLPVCLRAEYPEIPDPALLVEQGMNDRFCNGCVSTGKYLFESLGLTQHTFGQFLTADDRALARNLSQETDYTDIPQYMMQGIAVGEHAWAGALRYFASGNLAAEPQGEAVVRRYFEAALLTAIATKALSKQFSFDSSFFNHGIYCPQGVVGEVLRQEGTHVVNWNIAYRKQCFICSHYDTYHHTLLNEPTSVWEHMPWNAELEEQISGYLKSRWQGTNDWIWFHEKPEERFDKIAAEIGLDPKKPVIGMLTNVMWDAQLHYRANAFPDMLCWVFDTIEYFKTRPDLQLVIRIHPAEIRGTLPSRQPLLAEIHKRFATLPDNIFLIAPESPVSTYAVMEHCDSVIIYGTKMGVELTSVGIPVIVAGEAWIRNKGLTFDASTRDEYRQILGKLPIGQRLDPATTTKALKYAYHFFFRRMIPLGFMKPTGAWPPYCPDIDSLEGLMPGEDKGLDVICDGIMNGSAFIYPAEEIGAPHVV